MMVIVRNVLKATLGLGAIYWICLFLLVLSAHIGITKGEHPIYMQWVAMDPGWAYTLLLFRIASFGLAYWIIASKMAKDSEAQ